MNHQRLSLILRRLLLPSNIVLGFILAPAVLAIPEPTEQFYVNDAASILSDETEEYIIYGLPFYNSDNESAFKQSLFDILN